MHVDSIWDTVGRRKTQRIAKFLQRIILLEGLEHVAGGRVEDEIEINSGSSASWLVLFTLFLGVLVMVLCDIVYKLWKRLAAVEDELIEISELMA